MIDKDNIPNKWCLELATNEEDSDLISEYVRSIGGTHYENYNKHPMNHSTYVDHGKYATSQYEPGNWNYPIVTVEEFKKYILKLPEYQEEVINFDEDSEMIINNQLLTIRNDEIIKIKNLKYDRKI